MLLPYVIVTFLPNVLGLPERISIGGLFDSDEMIRTAFKISVKVVNKNALEHTMGVLLTSRAQKINNNVFQVANVACELVDDKVVGIFGPQDRSTASHVQSLCDALDIPCIAARWDPEPRRGNVVNLYPHADTLSMVLQDLIKEYKWKKYAILYDTTDSLIRVNRLLKVLDVNTFSVMMFHLGGGPDFRRIMQEIKMYKYRNIVIDCSYDILASVLEQALQVGIISERHRIIIASLDLQTLDLEPYRYSGANLTGVRLIDPESLIVQRVLKSQSWNLTDGTHLRVESALAYDAVQLFASGYARLRESVRGNLNNLSCSDAKIWGYGYSLSNYMRNEQIHGLSGIIRFDTAGFRSEFQLDVINMARHGLEKVGTWSANLGIRWDPKYKIPGDDDKTLRDEHFIVLISLTNPYGMYKQSVNTMTGNERYEGFAIDIIEEMSKLLGFNYTFRVQDDNAYGKFDNTTGKWTGMLGRIIDGEADLAITDLTITSERQLGVDFTTPFMNLGISVLYRKPTSAPPGLLSFLLPYSKEVWMYLIGAYIVVTLAVFLVGKLCPEEWTNPYPCIKEPEVLETPFTPIDTPFLTIGALLKSPTGFAPAGISTRALATAWWFFTLIICSTYIANLAAALSTKSPVWHFTVAEQLAFQHKIKYGAKEDGSTLAFFRNSGYPAYHIMYNYMKNHADEVLLKSNEAGVRKVQQENYAYLMESSSIEYLRLRKCNVTQIGGLLDAKGYGIAMRKNSYYRSNLNGAILKLQETGIMRELKIRWWEQKRLEGECEEKEQVLAEPLNFEDVGGVFLIMISGVMLSWIFTGWSFLWHIRRLAIENNVPYTEELMEELKILVKCSGRKTVKRRKVSVETIVERDSTDSSS